MRITLFLILTVTLSGSSCQIDDNASVFPEGVLGLKITERGFISEDIPDSMKLYAPSGLQLDSSGNVYILDEGTTEVKVFSGSGRPLNIIGGKGRGPGEFIRPSGFSVYKDSIYVFDQSLQRVNVFTLDGRPAATHPLKLAAPILLRPLGGGRHLGIHTDFYPGDREGKFGHVYTSGFSASGDPFLQIARLDPALEEAVNVLAFRPGSVLKMDENVFIFAPYFYNGRLYRFEESEDGWKHTKTYRGYTELSPFITLENNSNRHPDLTMETAGNPEPVEYLVYNQSRGLLRHNGRIYHFTHCEFDDGRAERVLGVEIFNDRMEPLGYVPIKRIPIANRRGNSIGWYAKDVDNDGNIYFIQRSINGDTIRRLSFEWQSGHNGVE